MMIQLETQFSCAHFYHQQKWDAKTNQENFGKCFDPHGHGHDYRILVTVPHYQMQTLKTVLGSLKEHLDHHHLNYWIETFKTEIPTTENLARYCWEYLKQQNSELEIRSLKLFETDSIYVCLQA